MLKAWLDGKDENPIKDKSYGSPDLVEHGGGGGVEQQRVINNIQGR